MTQYEKEYQYVEGLLKKAVVMDQLHAAQRALRQFIDTWVIIAPPTDKNFNEDRNKLMQLSQEKFSQISKAYLVRWKKFRIFVVWDTQINFMNKQFRARLLSVVN